MKSKTVITLTAAILVLILTQTLSAQYIEDALRYASPNAVITQRAGGLGISYLGLSDDYAALLLSPAGLSLINKSELSVGFGFQHNSTDATFQNNVTGFTANDAYLSHAGLIGPFKTKLGNAAIGLGYMLESNFNNSFKYDGFNRKNTMISWQTNYGTRNADDNWAYHLWLANHDLKTPITDSLQQSAFVEEKGGLHDIVGGAAFDLGANISAGLNLVGKFGNFTYSRDYAENDLYNKYNKFDTVTWKNLDFNTLTLKESLDQSIFGFTGAVGLQARIADFMRISVNVNFPTYFHFNEKYNIYARSRFDDGWEPNPYDPADPSEISYTLTTPFKYSIGASFHSAGLSIAAGAQYMDASQLEFSTANGDIVTNNDEIGRYLEQLNQTILKDLVGQFTWGFGAEYEIPNMPLVVRGSVQSTSSPYSQDIEGATRKTYAFGLGFYPAPSVRIDALYRFEKFSELRSNYGDAVNGSLYTMKLSPQNFGLQLTYRY